MAGVVWMNDNDEYDDDDGDSSRKNVVKKMRLI